MLLDIPEKRRAMGCTFSKPESCAKKVQSDSRLSGTSPAELQSAEVSGNRETTAFPPNRQEIGNLTESGLEHKLGNKKSSCCSQNQSMTKGRDFHLMVSWRLTQWGRKRVAQTGSSCWITGLVIPHTCDRQLLGSWCGSSCSPALPWVLLPSCRCCNWRFSALKRRPDSFKAKEVILYAGLPWSAGEEAGSCLCSCLGAVSHAVLQVRNLGAARASALRAVKIPGQQQMPGWGAQQPWFPIPGCYRQSTASPQNLCKATVLLQWIFIASLERCKCLSRIENRGESERPSQSQFFFSFIQKRSRLVTMQRCCVPSFEPTGLGYIHVK